MRAQPLYGNEHAPTRADMSPHPEANPAFTVAWKRACDRAWWGAILHAYRTNDQQDAWFGYKQELDAIQADWDSKPREE